MSKLTLSIAAIALASQSAFALVNLGIDFTETGIGLNRGPVGGDLDGAATEFDPNPTWNAVTSTAAFNNLVDEDGVATTIGFDFDDDAISFASQNSGGFFSSYAFLNGSGNPGTLTTSGFTISGLNPANTYTLYFYATWEFVDAGTEFAVSSDDGSNFTPFSLADGTPSVATAGFSEGSSFVVFEEVAPSASGNIVGSFRTTLAGDSSFHRGPFNAIQLVEVPEPSALSGLFGLAALLIARRRA